MTRDIEDMTDAQDEALLPCPFCGGAAEVIHIEDGENAGGSCVSCTRCLASSNLEFGFKENFRNNWNRRADLAHPSQAGDERVAGLLDTQIAAQDIIIKRQEAENARLREALWRLLREAEMDGMESRAGWDCWMHHARAALAAMDTPKGGGDE